MGGRMADSSVNVQIGGADAWRQRVPNALTLLRVAIAVAFFVALARLDATALSDSGPRWGPIVAAALFAIAALTDALDGWLARRWGAITAFGRVVDPAADKLLILGAFALLSAPALAIAPGSVDATVGESIQLSGVQAWMVVVLIARELLSTSIRAVAEGAGVAFAANWWGKTKMIAQSLCAPLALLALGLAPRTALVHGWARGMIDIAVWVMVLVTVGSAWPYLRAVARTFASADIAAVRGADSRGKA